MSLIFWLYCSSRRITGIFLCWITNHRDNRIVKISLYGRLAIETFKYFYDRTHMQDLKEVTDFLHYESYRRKRFSRGSNGEHSPLDEKPEVTHENSIISESDI